MVRRFILPAIAVAAMLVLSANSASAKMAFRTHGDACEAVATDAGPADCGCGGGSCDSCCNKGCGWGGLKLFSRCCKPKCCEPVCCEAPKCCKPKCCKPKCCKPVCCKPACDSCCDPCGSCCRPTPIRDLFAGLRDALHSCCCGSCCDSCGCGAPAASCGCGH